MYDTVHVFYVFPLRESFHVLSWNSVFRAPSILFFIIYSFNIIQHNITINFTATGRKKVGGGGGGKNSKKKKKKKQSEIQKFNRLTATGRTNRKIIIARVC